MELFSFHKVETWREIMDMIKYSSLRSPVICIQATMLCMVNFTTANIYNVHRHTLTWDLKNYMTPLRNLNRRVSVEKVLYWLSKYDCNTCRRISDKLRCFVNVLCLLTDSENMLKLKEKTQEIHIFFTFWH